MTTMSLRSLVLAGERRLNLVIVMAAAVLLAVASLAGMYQVFSRFVMRMPAAWTEPLVRVTLIWMVYLGLMAGARTGSLITVNFLYEMTSGRLREISRLMIALSVLSMLGILVWYGWIAVYMVRNQTIAGLGISASWVYSAIPVGAGFAAIAVIVHFFDPPADRQ